MSAYVFSLLAASAAVCIIELLLPKGDGGRVASQVRLVSGLILLIALLNPLREGVLLLRTAATGELVELLEESLPPIPTLEDREEAFGATLSEVGRQEVEAWVRDILETVFSIPAEGCAVEAVCVWEGETDSPTLILRELRIGLRGSYALQDPHPMEDFFSRRLECPCYVTVLL